MKRALLWLAFFCTFVRLTSLAATPNNPVDVKLRNAYRRLYFAQQYPTNDAQFIQAQLQDAKQPLSVMTELAKDSRGSVRVLLAMLVGEYGESDGAKILWPLTLDELESVRLTAAGALTRLSHLTSITINPVGLDDSRPTVRRLTVSIFAAIRDKAGEDALLAHVFKEEDEFVRREIVSALGTDVCGTDKSLPSMLKSLHDPSVEVRQAAAWESGTFSNALIVDPLIQTLKDPDWHVRAAAAHSVGGQWVKGNPDIINALVDALENDKFSLVRDRAADGLIAVADTDDKVVTALVHAIGSEERSVRFHAMQAIIAAKASRALPLLAEIRHHTDPDVREIIMDIFGQIGGLNQISMIVEATSDVESQVQTAAVHRLKNRGGMPALMARLEAKDPHVRAAAARAFGDMGDKVAVPKLLPLLRDDNGYVRSAAAEALGKLGDRTSIEPLIQILNGSQLPNTNEIGLVIGNQNKFNATLELTATQTKIRAVEALGVLRADEAVDSLIQFGLKDKDPLLRAASAYTLGRTRDPRAVDPLLDVVRPYYMANIPAASGIIIYDGQGKMPDEQRRSFEKEARVRASVAWALGQIADPKASEILQKAMDDANSLVRDAAIEAMARILEKQERDQLAAEATNTTKAATEKKLP